jgi:hypothetical protein
MRPHIQRAIDEGMEPAAVADHVADAIMTGRFWVLPRPEWVELAVRRWHRIAEGENPDTGVDVPGLPPTAQWTSEIRSALMMSTGQANVVST